MKNTSHSAGKSNFYAMRVTAGQEENVIAVASLRIRTQGIPIRSLLAPPGIKGIIIVEADNIGTLNTTLSGIRHVKKIIYGNVDPEEVRDLITLEEKVVEYGVGDLVEVVSGPFKDMKGKVVRAERDKREVVIEFLDATFTLPVTITTDMLRKAK